MIKWKGYEDKTWEPESNINAPSCIVEFEKEHQAETGNASSSTSVVTPSSSEASSSTASSLIPYKKGRGLKSTAQVKLEPISDGTYLIEGIINKRTNKQNKIQYCVKWVGYKTPTWEPRENLLEGCPEAIEEFEIELAKRKSASHSSLSLSLESLSLSLESLSFSLS